MVKRRTHYYVSFLHTSEVLRTLLVSILLEGGRSTRLHFHSTLVRVTLQENDSLFAVCGCALYPVPCRFTTTRPPQLPLLSSHHALSSFNLGNKTLSQQPRNLHIIIAHPQVLTGIRMIGLASTRYQKEE